MPEKMACIGLVGSIAIQGPLFSFDDNIGAVDGRSDFACPVDVQIALLVDTGFGYVAQGVRFPVAVDNGYDVSTTY